MNNRRHNEDRIEQRLAGRKFCSLDLGGDDPAPPQPDPQIGEAAKVSAEVSREQLAYQKERDAALAPMFEKIISSQVGSMEENRARASEQWGRYKEKGIPIEDAYLKEALDYGTPEEQERQAGRAMQDTQAQFDVQQGAQRRDLLRYGVNPASGRFAGSERALTLGRAASTAAAGTNAREKTRLLGLSMREGAAKFVRGMPTTGIAADSLALNAGTGAGNTAGQQSNIHNAGTSLGLNANAQGAGILNTQFNNQMQGYNAAQQANRDTWSGVGSAVGLGAAVATKDPRWLAFGMKKGGQVRRRPRTLSYAGRVGKTYVNGGEAVGPGSGESDSIPVLIDGQEPAAISDGEYVIKADTTQNVYGPQVLDDVNQGKAEVIPSPVLTEIGRHHIRSLAMAMAAPTASRPRTLSGASRMPITINQGD